MLSAIWWTVRTYEEAVLDRDGERAAFQRLNRRGRRRGVFVYPRSLKSLPEFSSWVLDEVHRQQRSGSELPPEVVDLAIGPLDKALAYKSMYAYGHHFCVLSAELSKRTSDSGIAVSFHQVCRNRVGDKNEVQVLVEYVRQVEEILKLNYRRPSVNVLFCNFVQANYIEPNATIKKNKWGFTLANYNRRMGTNNKDSFTFPKHCKQVFYCNAREAPGWRVVMKKEVRGRRVLPDVETEDEQRMFNMEYDNRYEGLQAATADLEEPPEEVNTGHNVVLQEVLLPRGRRAVRGNGVRGRPTNLGSGRRRNPAGLVSEGRRGKGRFAGGATRGNHSRQQRPSISTAEGSSEEEDEQVEEDGLQEVHRASAGRSRARQDGDEENNCTRRSRRRIQSSSSSENEEFSSGSSRGYTSAMSA